ncbi:MAG: Asp-tRNA(Asn)/Glu-tRNA(Gln) amidotransferase subunit GatA [Clostridiales bacterium]|jgi:aspartyl-tRNA(Asn)/glutamyl-tRNA(Gln) amidotransferase subunit A|nr:Asp-tRNA(Asn)/Glu-tRNA(Gln) amidotransferase subunit GatA [Clostridiales bacterium]
MLIKKLREMLDARQISAWELAQAYLARIEKRDPELGAYLHVSADVAKAMAGEAQRRIDAGGQGALTGIPVGLKDILCTSDMPTTCASRMLEGYRPPYDATVVGRLRAQGAVFLGKLNMDEFAMGSTTRNSAYKPAKNPFDPNRVPGGSSGGSAAAVAASLCAAALGSDTGGSIRQPASFCGVTGHRPTYGLVSRYGCVAFASSLDQVGPLAASASDCAAVLDAICGPDPHDQTTSARGRAAPAGGRPGTGQWPGAGMGARMGESLKGKRLGIIAELMGAEVEPDVLRCVEEAAKWYESAGATVKRVSLPMLRHAVPAYYLISSAEASANLSRFDGVRYGRRAGGAASYGELIAKSRAEGFGREVKRRILLGTYALCSGYYDAYYKRAVHLAGIVRAQYDGAFADCDALLSPVSPTAAFEAGKVPDDPAQVYVADICTVSASLAGLPSISTPCGYTAGGMPVGLMITGRRWDDPLVLALADAFERDFERRDPAGFGAGDEADAGAAGAIKWGE